MNSTAPERSYTGDSIYVGIDVHKKTYSVVARVKHLEVKRWTMSADPKQLAHQLHKYFQGADIYTAYEAGFSGYVLHRELDHQGIHSIVVHAAAIAVKVHDRVKTDKRDARKIAEQLEAGQ